MRVLPVAALALLAGCKSLSPDAGFVEVQKAVEERTGAQAKWIRAADEADSVRARVKELLAGPLTASLINTPHAERDAARPFGSTLP